MVIYFWYINDKLKELKNEIHEIYELCLLTVNPWMISIFVLFQIMSETTKIMIKQI